MEISNQSRPACLLPSVAPLAKGESPEQTPPGETFQHKLPAPELMSKPGLAAPASVATISGLAGYGEYLENQLVDGVKNACGTCSLAGILNYWSGQKQYSRAGLDEQIRHGDLTTSPHQLARFARSQGFRSEAVHEMSCDQLADLVDQGVPVQIVVKSFVHPGALHYITAVGATRDSEGQPEGFRFADTSGAQMRDLDLKELEERWHDLTYKGIPTGLNHPALIHLPSQPTSVKGVDGVIRDASQIELPNAHSLPWTTHLVDWYLQAANMAISLSHALIPPLQKP